MFENEIDLLAWSLLLSPKDTLKPRVCVYERDPDDSYSDSESIAQMGTPRGGNRERIVQTLALDSAAF
jgi:hypothetical protein